MQEEIKEILDIIKKVSKAEVNSYNGLIETPPMKWEIFLDYITNLQEENEKLKKKLNCKEVYSTYMPDNLEFVIMTKKDYERHELDYKSRNEKAIEYLKIGLSNYEEQEELLNLLQGVDKE